MFDEDYESYLNDLSQELDDSGRVHCNDPDHEHDYSLGLRGDPIKVKDKDAERKARFLTKDSGTRAKYSDGMQRDTTEGKPQFALLFPEGVPYEDQLMTRVADLYHRGGVKYGPRNWEKSSTEESLAHHKECLLRHVMKFMLGVEDGEDHAAAVVWNVNAVDLTRRKINMAEAEKSWPDKELNTRALPDNEVTRKIDDFLDSHEPPLSVVEFADRDELLDKNYGRWEYRAATGGWHNPSTNGWYMDGIGSLASAFGPLMIQTGAFAGLTILKDGSKRWG